MLAFPDPVSEPRGRYAPSPTGLLHVGSARTALVAWLSVRSGGGRFVMRVEDLDGPRVVPGMEDAIRDDLAWLGLDWDEGPDVGGPFGPYRQSERSRCYEEAIDLLYAQGRVFPCRRSRKDLLEVASAPHGGGSLPPYPASLRPRRLEPGWLEGLRRSPNPDAAIRFRVASEPVVFTDRVYGTRVEHVDQAVGDFVVKRRDGVYAYQLAVVVDDLLMGINEVVRGEDLLDSTARQIQLIEALGGTRPVYAHVPLVVNAAGEKLSKRDRSLTLRSLRASGVTSEALVGYLAWSLGFLPEPMPCTAGALVPHFSWDRIPKEPWRLPEDLAGQLRRLC